jgi:Thioesterase-like superfamily
MIGIRHWINIILIISLLGLGNSHTLNVNIFVIFSVAGICLSNDVDTLLYHMNNARYLRELDFARVDFYERSGLYRAIKAKGGAVVQGACTVRYRRFIRPFSVFKIHSKVSLTIIAYYSKNPLLGFLFKGSL